MEKRGKKPRRYASWLCDCGERGSSPLESLKSGHTKSCGCLRREKARVSIRETNTNHGMCNTRTYRSWHAMKTRCNNPNTKDYINYGGRGIKYDNSWESFEVFLSDMGERPEGKTIDRKDNDGNYCKENCHWATALEQIHNRRI